MLDRGDLLGCRKTLEGNSAWLKANAELYKCPSLNDRAESNLKQLDRLKDATSNAAPAALEARKSMRYYQNRSDSQQSQP